ncbi:MAG: carbohydrate ABC transporter permease [Clostridiales bacterium]|jgi:putative aldouronate transport system permease protein|nr:carbohydrate ABC transporter permease [Clostridiales bacterium]
MTKLSIFKRNPNKIKQRPSEAIFGAAVMVSLVILMIFFIYPFYNCIVLSFNDGRDATREGLFFLPRVFTMDNYSRALRAEGFGMAAVMSVLRTGIATTLSVMVCSMFGYAMSKNHLRFRKLYMTLAMIPMFFSGGMIPSFLLIRNIGLYNNFLVYILPGLFSMFYAIIFMGSFREIPASLEESAMLDGANHVTLFYRIILPVSKPVIAAISIFTAVGHWNSWMDTMLYTRKEGLNTLAYLFSKVIFSAQYLQSLVESNEGGSGGGAAQIAAEMRGATSTSIMVAAMVLATVPITLIYPFFQKHFTKGVMIGSIKG